MVGWWLTMRNIRALVFSPGWDILSRSETRWAQRDCEVKVMGTVSSPENAGEYDTTGLSFG